MLGMVLTVSVVMLLTSCKKDEINNNGNTNVSQDEPDTDHLITNAVTDIDGNHYNAVKLGNQVWMAENLRTTHFADGTDIIEDCGISYDNPYRFTPSSSVTTYGYLYNWAAVMYGANGSNNNPSGVQGVCPTGWHVPSAAEWSELITYIGSQSEYVCDGSSNNVAKALASENGWNSFNGDACAVGNNPSTNNVTGFSAYPAGHWAGGFIGLGSYNMFWTATGGGYEARFYSISFNYANVRALSETQYRGGSVRCVRD